MNFGYILVCQTTSRSRNTWHAHSHVTLAHIPLRQCFSKWLPRGGGGCRAMLAEARNMRFSPLSGSGAMKNCRDNQQRTSENLCASLTFDISGTLDAPSAELQLQTRHRARRAFLHRRQSGNTNTTLSQRQHRRRLHFHHFCFLLQLVFGSEEFSQCLSRRRRR